MDKKLTEEELQELKRVKDEFDKCSVRPAWEVKECEEVMLPMKDEMSLRTIIYRPKREGKVPVVAARSCYPHCDTMYRAIAQEYCRRGFGYIYQYCRGTGGSQGQWEPNMNERSDGKETIDWICSLPWVRNVGYYGSSYLALTGWVIADILPQKVKTMYLTHYGTFRFTSVYKDGMFRHDVLTAWTMENAGYPVTADYLESCKYRPHIEVDEKLWGKRIDWYRKWITSTDRESEYWNTGFWEMLKGIPAKVKVPLFIGEGWYDHHLASAIETYQALSEECKEKSRFLLGAWEHGFHVKLQDRQGNHYENNDILRAFYWFQELLEEEKVPQGNVEYYLIGDDSWKTRKRFDLDHQQEHILYLGSKDQDATYLLKEEKPEEEGFFGYQYDPARPVMTHGAESLLRTQEEQGSLRHYPPGYRDDVISCVSEPFSKDVALLGKIKVDLEVSSDAEDTSFVVKVMELKQNGESYHMRTGITTLGYRNGSSKRIAYQPGEKVKIQIDTWDLAWKIQKGSRIRIDITSSDFPQYSIHSNYPGCWAQQREIKAANQRIYFGNENCSCVRLPLLSD